MIISRFQIGIFTVLAVAVSAIFVWEVRENQQLRSQAGGPSRSTPASIAALERQVAAESRRVAAAEAKVATLLQAAKSTGALRATASPAASVTTDTEEAVKASLARASQLIKDGRFQEALDEYLTSYRELRAVRLGSLDCQRLMVAIKHLGRNYPAALTALAGLRDNAMAELKDQPGRRELPFEIALLNERLGEGRRTVALFDSLTPNDPGRQSLVRIAYASFVDARRYTDALLGKSFGQMLAWIEAGSSNITKEAIVHQAEMRQATVDATLVNIEVLTGAGKIEDARILTEKLLAFDSSETTRAALKHHVGRALIPWQ